MGSDEGAEGRVELSSVDGWDVEEDIPYERGRSKI